MRQYSEIFDKWYSSEDKIFVRNCKQAAHYHGWGAPLVDLFVDGNYKWVFVFDRSQHEKHRDRWGTKDNNHVDD